MQELLAIFILSPIGVDNALEAVDVLYFCSEECRQIIAQNTAHQIKLGVSGDWLEGTVCDECGKAIS